MECTSENKWRKFKKKRYLYFAISASGFMNRPIHSRLWPVTDSSTCCRTFSIYSCLLLLCTPMGFAGVSFVPCVLPQRIPFSLCSLPFKPTFKHKQLLFIPQRRPPLSLCRPIKWQLGSRDKRCEVA